ncbi:MULTISPECIES: RraA family protein [unclassified Achromobacter]|uniref:RraA family protein n=1 Tax=unclassified Achromobacter TaxID=2626865 RepID=UPI000B51D5C2|nr:MULTISPECIES: RraA family protein [unclassified Achromobacter]OWT80694.1 dimethylmenaquinone methyltransferase [Achromobacter sp. HZ34]OWT81210.1 dimethylmenaquinone methyltransferase [Achromobacter sp. HZ28]
MDESSQDALLRQLDQVSFPTLGHFLEEGFASPLLRALVPGVKVVGRARTLKLAAPNAYAVNRCIVRLRPGEVLVIDASAIGAHAPIGAVTGTALQCAGAAGVIVHGVITDVLELRAMGLPVFAYGTSLLTNKLEDDVTSAHDIPVQCGGVLVCPGDIVLADDNGVMFLTDTVAAHTVEMALASDAAEPDVLARMRAGEPLDTLLKLAP